LHSADYRTTKLFVIKSVILNSDKDQNLVVAKL